MRQYVAFTFFIMVFSCSLVAGEGQVALITGASRGVGLETAKCLEEDGFTVYATTRSISQIDDEVKNIHFLSVDLTDAASVQSAVDHILEKEGKIDVLINNAGYAAIGPIESLTEKEYKDQMEINFYAPIRLVQAVLPSMRERKSGHIINISSTNAVITPPFGSMYAASKAALESFSESLCIEVTPYDIAVSIVEPGMLQTSFSLILGKKEVLGDPYRDVITAIEEEIKERMAHPENLPFSQSPREIAELLLKIIKNQEPKLRYQTSEWAREEVSKKIRDLTGEIYLEEIRKFLESIE